MPQVVRCPNCHAPLDKAPAGAGDRCPYCGVPLHATQYQPAPPAPPAEGGPPQPHPIVPPQPPPTCYIVPAPPLGMDRKQHEAMMAQQQEAARKRSRSGTIISIVVTLVMIGSVVAVSFFARREAERQVNVAQQAIAQAQTPTTVQVPPQDLEPGTRRILRLLPSTAQGHVAARYNLRAAAAGPYEISVGQLDGYARCRLKVAGPDNDDLGGASEDDFVQVVAALPAGVSQVLVECENSGVERSVFVLARPALVVRPDAPVTGTIEVGLEGTRAPLEVPEAGRWAVTFACEDTSLTLQVVDPAGIPLGKQYIDANKKRAVVEADLAPSGFAALAVAPSALGVTAPIAFALTRIDPQPIEVGASLTATMTRFVDRGYFSFTLAEPGRVEATVRSAAFAHKVELRQADGVPIAASGYASAGDVARAVPPVDLPAGDYGVVVIDAETGPSEGPYEVAVRVVAPETTTRRQHRGR
jgi:hypothetical protein